MCLLPHRKSIFWAIFRLEIESKERREFEMYTLIYGFAAGLDFVMKVENVCPMTRAELISKNVLLVAQLDF